MIPSPKLASSKAANRTELSKVLSNHFFQCRNFNHPNKAASNLINLVAETVFNNITSFAPKTNPLMEGNPSVVVQPPTTNKEPRTRVDRCMKYFQNSWDWHSPVKLVSPYCSYHLEEEIMQDFTSIASRPGGHQSSRQRKLEGEACICSFWAGPRCFLFGSSRGAVAAGLLAFPQRCLD